jgi:hypothetical protein
MNIEVITSFNEHYYNLIGKDSLESWLTYWPENLTLTCYVEEFKLPKLKRIKQIDFSELDPAYEIFQHTKGIGGQERKFAKKSFSFIHAMFNSNADRIIWLDADVITKQKLPLELLMSILPENVLSTHMGVTYLTAKDGTPGRWFVPETGFFAVNTKHSDFLNFRNEYRRHFIEQDSTNLRRFYDNDVYGYVFEKLGSAGLDLCKDFKKPYKTPMKHTVLGDYLDHYKAKHSKHEYQTTE